MFYCCWGLFFFVCLFVCFFYYIMHCQEKGCDLVLWSLEGHCLQYDVNFLLCGVEVTIPKMFVAQ